MDLIYCDNHILVLDKPSGIATQPDFHEMARDYVKKRFTKKGNVFLEPLHRLDKPASGIVVFARTSKALSRLNEALRQRLWQKTYLALVEGVVRASGTLEHFLIHGNFRAVIDSKGKKAILHYQRVKEVDGYSLVRVNLETGRYHQIRAQFSAIGHPIVGDEKYGSCTKGSRIWLHHAELSLIHPTTKEALTFQSQCSFSSEAAKVLSRVQE